jgi:hypothetical protein
LKGQYLLEALLIENATPEQTVRLYVREHADWIGSQLGCKLEEAVLLSLSFSVSHLAIASVLDGV